MEYGKGLGFLEDGLMNKDIEDVINIWKKDIEDGEGLFVSLKDGSEIVHLVDIGKNNVWTTFLIDCDEEKIIEKKKRMGVLRSLILSEENKEKITEILKDNGLW